MKKLLGFASLLLIALLTACNADNLDEIVEAGKAVVQVPNDSEMPIELSICSSSTTTSVTRAPLDTEDGNFETPDGQYLGVFALAQTNTPAGGQAGPVATDAIMWDGTVQYARLMWNVPTKAMETTNPHTTLLQFLDKSTLNNQTPSASIYSYPRNNWYNYHFYSYYPRVDDANVSVTNNVVTADYTLDGSQDIITGVATPPANKINDGFCRKYFEDNPSSGSPQLQLNRHLLSQLRFFVCSKSYVDDETQFQVKDITLKNVPTEWTLTIADKASSVNTGTLTSRSAAKADFPVREMTVNASNKMLTASDDAVFVGDNAKDLSTTKQCVGYAMIPPSAVIHKANNTLHRGFSNNYEISLTIQLNDEEVTLTRTIQEPQVGGGFVAGKVYNIIVTIDQTTIGGGSISVDPRAVDLGLSVLWANCNIGANVTDLKNVDETEKGLMFTWGGTTGYSSSSTSDGHNFVMSTDPHARKQGTKWSWRDYKGEKLVLTADDDAAKQAEGWGSEWRMPTKLEYEELITNTTQTWQTNYKGSGVNGMLFTSTKPGFTDKSIFFPVAGYRDGTSFVNRSCGYYWSSTVYTGNSYYNAWHLYFTSSSVSVVYGNSDDEPVRYNGLSVRAVLPKE